MIYMQSVGRVMALGQYIRESNIPNMEVCGIMYTHCSEYRETYLLKLEPRL